MGGGNGPAAIIAVALMLALLTTGVYDVLAVYGLVPGRTVSVVLYSWAQQFPVMPFILGLILGHLFWPVFPTR